VNKKEQNLLIIVIIVIVGATAIIVSLALASQAQREFEQQYALKQFFGGTNFAYGQNISEQLNGYGDPVSNINNDTYVAQKLQEELEKIWRQEGIIK